MTLPNKTWNGTPIEYRYLATSEYANFDGIVFVHTDAYQFPNGDPRYVALDHGKVIAVQTSYNGFCNMCVDPLFPHGGLLGMYPDYIRKNGLTYSVPIVSLS